MQFEYTKQALISVRYNHRTVKEAHLSATLGIRAVEVSAISHATEDLEKVCSALRNVASEEIAKRARINRQDLKGHHGNPIVTLIMKIRGTDVVEAFVQRLASRLSDGDKRFLSAEFTKHIDADGNLYMRLDKQAALLGRMSLKQEDPIRVRIKLETRLRTPEQIGEALRRLGLIE